ncbi:troponin I, slow skeletal muscle-like isoform X2 [Acanthopagrus latus]|uniref:troponin I, slow skeletal muscle-like isoform X2 n=1 Tax=Acanthopagrus latus TaxID=8177 RepID=UPI00187CDC00|nr:troponin I, slow skeletal muscle-like isoform X2 [Acanthopagrus latus]
MLGPMPAHSWDQTLYLLSTRHTTHIKSCPLSSTAAVSTLQTPHLSCSEESDRPRAMNLRDKPKSKISASRKLSLKMLLLQRACEDLEKETQDREEEKVRYLGEKLPPLQLSGLSLEELQNLCKQLHSKIDITDEERYDCESKVSKHNKDIHELKLKVQDLGGKFKKPALRKVRVSADEMMRALLGSKHKGSMDLRANLKSVKKEDVKQDKVLTSEVGDWRKNVEAMSGMEGRKKMFDTGGGAQ